MSTTTFKGARYIPKFYGVWTDEIGYEAIGVVKHNAFTYISKQPVPIGVPITNTDFWLLWADPNAQMEELRQIVAQYVVNVEELAGVVGALSNELDQEIEARTQADNNLDDKIEQETDSRIEADNALDGRIDNLENDLNINSLYTVDTGIDSNSNSAYVLITIPKGNTEFGYLYRNLYFPNIPVYEFVSKIDYLLGFNGSLVGVTVANGNVLENLPFSYSQYFYILGFDENNEPKYAQDLTRNYTGLQLVEAGYETAFGIWSPIIENNVVFDWDNILPDDDPNVDIDDLYNRKHTRTIFGYDANNYYVLAIDGRLVNSQGATFDEMRALCQNIGMTYAFNLDGGGSSQVWTCGKSAFNFVFPDNSTSNNVYSTRSVPGLISVKEK